jgi:hypothetical protein
MHPQALITLTNFSYCTVDTATPPAAAAEAISPLPPAMAQNLDHGSPEVHMLPFAAAPFASTTRPAADADCTTASWPDSTRTSQPSQKHGRF